MTGAGATVAAALRLAFGTTDAADAVGDWPVVFATASRELLAPLAWSRSGAFIRRHADAPTAAAWRRAALAAHLRGQQQLDQLAGVLAAFDDARVDAVVLKGLPLGEWLYRDPFVRCPADIDLYVPASQRLRASAARRTLGWTHADGAPPWHEAWSRRRGALEFHLELHSALVSDHLTHLPVPAPAGITRSVAGVTVRAHAGPFVAPSLAVHLVTHQMSPLLWLVDFATLWAGFSAADRAEAAAAAEHARLSRYLAWACRRAGEVERAAAGDEAALRALGLGRTSRRDVHSIWRHLALAASLGDRMRVAGAFAVPRRVRGDVAAMARYTVARLRTRVSSLGGVSRRYAPMAPAADGTGGESARGGARPLRLGREDLVSLTRDVVRAGGALRVRAPGGSMLPTIPRGALVRIGPVPPDGIGPGDIVLALTADGEPVLHRAVALVGDSVIMRGDAALADDAPTPLRRVIGVATHVECGAEWRALGPRPPRSIMVTALKLRRRLAKAVRRGS